MKTTALYIHIPFCQRKCLFCSFVIAVGQEHRRQDYVQALIAQMRLEEKAFLQSLYVGGGTPTLLENAQIQFLMAAVRNHFQLTADIESTIEANPDTIDAAKAACLKMCGFNRVSLGVQSTNARYLQFLGRTHSVEQSQKAYLLLRGAGFENINLDLMYGFPGQTKDALEQDVRALATMGSEHVSLYTLTIEPQSRFYATRMRLDDTEVLAERYALVASLLKEYGFNQYEISNFSKAGFECVHNKNYWQGDSYIGLGVGAHGFTGTRRYWQGARLHAYLARAVNGKDFVEGYEDIPAQTRVMEKVLFGLRMNAGIAWGLVPIEKQALIQTWIKEGFLVLDEGFLKTTDKGRLVLDALSSRLI